jgi:hypothetical protein
MLSVVMPSVMAPSQRRGKEDLKKGHQFDNFELESAHSAVRFDL